MTGKGKEQAKREKKEKKPKVEKDPKSPASDQTNEKRKKKKKQNKQKARTSDPPKTTKMTPSERQAIVLKEYWNHLEFHPVENYEEINVTSDEEESLIPINSLYIIDEDKKNIVHLNTQLPDFTPQLLSPEDQKKLDDLFNSK